MIRDAAGNLYGTTPGGGVSNAGVVYKLDPAGKQTVLYSFTAGADGGYPYSGVIGDAAGNLYGTTVAGGGSNAGVVYKLDPAGHETVLYSFKSGIDGGQPEAGVIRDQAGNLYGTTLAGGGDNGGVVFMLDPQGRQTVLHSFTRGADGAYPSSGVIRGPAGNLSGLPGRAAQRSAASFSKSAFPSGRAPARVVALSATARSAGRNIVVQ